jgi:hypothetical protein
MRYQRWALGGLLLVHALTAHAQPETVLAGPASCRECRVELEQIVVLGDSIGPGMLQEQSVLATDGRGRFYVTSPDDPTIAVFDGGGRFLRRVGRRGQGPGEFTMRPTMLFGLRDTLYAITGGTRRMTVFSPEYEVVRTGTLSHSFSTAVRLQDGRFLLAGVSPQAETMGNPLHLVDHEGASVLSFGATPGARDLAGADRPVRPGRVSRAVVRDAARRIAPPVGPTVWMAKLDEYVLEQWNLEGRKLAQITRQVSWFPPNVQLPPNATGATHRLPPELQSLSEDKAGFLWTLSTVPDGAWRPRTFPDHPTGGTYTPDSLRHKLSDSVIEVLDPARGVVLATRTFDTLFTAFIAPDLLVSFTEDAAGNPRYVVWRARLVSASR